MKNLHGSWQCNCEQDHAGKCTVSWYEEGENSG